MPLRITCILPLSLSLCLTDNTICNETDTYIVTETDTINFTETDKLNATVTETLSYELPLSLKRYHINCHYQ